VYLRLDSPVVPAELGGNIRGVVGAIRDTAFGNRHAKASKQAVLLPDTREYSFFLRDCQRIALRPD
jgi:hypothetical protein